MPKTDNQVTRALSVRCLFALGAVAALALANFVVLREEIRAHELGVELLTVSGRQRTLLQSTALLAQALVSTHFPEERSPLRLELLEAIEPLEAAHHRLFEFDAAGTGDPPPEVQEIYESSPWLLDTEVRNYLTHLRELARSDAAELNLANPHYRYIRQVALERRVMGGLDAVVAAYQEQSEARAAQLRGLARWSFVSTLVVLGLTGAFVFRPMVRRVRHDMAALQDLNETLEERVAERTAVAEERTVELASSEAALRRQTRILQSILDSMGEGVIVADRERKFLLVNPAARQLLQIGSEDEVPGTWSEQWAEAFGLTAYLPDGQTPYPADQFPLVRALRGDPDVRAEVLLRNANAPAPETAVAHGLWLSITARPLRTPEGNVHGAVAVLRDVTERKRAEHELKDSEALYHSLVDNLPLGVVRKDLEGRFTYVNELYCRLTAMTMEAAIGATDFDVFPRREAERSRRDDQRVVQTGRVFQQVQQHTAPDGRTMFLELLKSPVLDSAGAVVGTQTVVRDITERKAAEERMLRAERLAAVGEMVTGVAHESRNALQQIGACAKMLEWEVNGHGEAAGLIADVHQAHDRLHRLFENLRGYVAPLRIDRRFSNLHDVFLEAWASVAPLREGRDVSLHDETGGLDVRCMVDPFPMEQVFRNILENSLAACDDPVRISVRWRAASIDGKPAIRVTLGDNGPGLAPEVSHRIFEPFYTTKTQGTGLGMAIVQRIVEAHGGRIEVVAGGGGRRQPGSQAAGRSARRGAELQITLPRGNS